MSVSNDETVYHITWPAGVSDPWRSLFGWPDVAEYIEDAVKEAVQENELALTDGETFGEDYDESDTDSVFAACMKRYRQIAQPRQIEPGLWESKILGEAAYGSSPDRFYTLTIREEAS